MVPAVAVMSSSVMCSVSRATTLARMCHAASVGTMSVFPTVTTGRTCRLATAGFAAMMQALPAFVALFPAVLAIAPFSLEAAAAIAQRIAVAGIEAGISAIGVSRRVAVAVVAVGVAGTGIAVVIGTIARRKGTAAE